MSSELARGDGDGWEFEPSDPIRALDDVQGIGSTAIGRLSMHGYDTIEDIDEAGVRTFVSMSPTYPTQDREDLRSLLERISETNPGVVFHEPINPRGSNFEMTVRAARQAGEHELARALDQLRDRDTWLRYAVEHYRAVQEIGSDLGLPVHLWPDDQHIKHADGPVSRWLTRWKERQSPESFAGRDTPDDDPPRVPPEATDQDSQLRLGDQT